MYRLSITPWDRYVTTAADGIASLLEREESERSRPPGRALALGCCRGQHTALLAARGWEAMGIDNVPAAIEDSRRTGAQGASYVTRDMTDLPASDLGTFDFFLDVGCFQGLSSRQRDAHARGVRALANPGATLLLLAFGRTWMRSVVDLAATDTATRRCEADGLHPASSSGTFGSVGLELRCALWREDNALSPEWTWISTQHPDDVPHVEDPAPGEPAAARPVPG